jgi:hypothetical protein
MRATNVGNVLRTVVSIISMLQPLLLKIVSSILQLLLRTVVSIISILQLLLLKLVWNTTTTTCYEGR